MLSNHPYFRNDTRKAAILLNLTVLSDMTVPLSSIALYGFTYFQFQSVLSAQQIVLLQYLMSKKIIRLILILGALYWLYSKATNSSPQQTQLNQVLQVTQAESNSSSFADPQNKDTLDFSSERTEAIEDSPNLIVSVVSGAFSLIGSFIGFIGWAIGLFFRFIWFIIQNIWLIKTIWIIVMVVLNIVVMCCSFHIFSREAFVKQPLGFFFLFVVLVLLTYFVNNYLVHPILARNIFLPIYLTQLVAILNNRVGDQKIPRNLVFFTLICALL